MPKMSAAIDTSPSLHELECFTRDLLGSGVQADLLTSAIQAQCAAAPGIGIQIHVDKSRSIELASTLAKVVDDPMSVRVTDARGKPVALRPGCTHVELAELVCRSGCELHIRPAKSHAATAASLVNGVDGRVVIPGAASLSGITVVDEALQALREGNHARLAGMGQEIERLGLLNVTEASRAFYTAITGIALDGVAEEWTVAMNYAFRSWNAQGCITVSGTPEAGAQELAAPYIEESAEITIATDQSAADPNATRLIGDANAMELLELAQFLHVSGKTGALSVTNDQETLHLWYQAGNLVHAECGPMHGLEAALRLTTTRDARTSFAFTADAQPSATSITLATPMLLLDLSRSLDEQDF